MVGEEVLAVLPDEVLGRIDNLITLLQAVGVLALAYFVWMIVRGVLTLRMNKRIGEMQKDIQKIKRKLKIK